MRGYVFEHKALDEQHMHLLFRGQSNSTYPLVASIFRRRAGQAMLERAKRLLAWYLASNSGLKIAVDPTLFMEQPSTIKSGQIFSTLPLIPRLLCGGYAVKGKRPDGQHLCHSLKGCRSDGGESSAAAFLHQATPSARSFHTSLPVSTSMNAAN